MSQIVTGVMMPGVKGDGDDGDDGDGDAQTLPRATLCGQPTCDEQLGGGGLGRGAERAKQRG